jgi:LPXTG-motif cell wall-anchored protein
MFAAALSCLAGGVAAPEIDPTSAGAAVALLAGGLLVIRYRRKK